MCLTFAGDEAGDASFAFDKGASTHFVLALIATAQPDALRQALARVRDKRGLPAGYEFKYHKLSSAALRQATFEALQAMDFAVWALTVDKTELPAYWRALDAHSFYALLATELIVQVPLAEREGATLLLDEFDPRGKALLALKRALKRRQIRRGFRKMLNVRSRSEPLVQIADLVAGSILCHIAHGDVESLDYIRDRFRLIHRFEAGLQKNPPS
jgi:hypothetical protein